MKKAATTIPESPQKTEESDDSKLSAHFGGEQDEENSPEKNFDSNELHFQLMKSNNITKKLAMVFSTLVAKIKDLELQNKNLSIENEEIKKQSTIKDRIIIEKNAEIADKIRKIEELTEISSRLEKEMMRSRAKISQAMNIAFEKGAPELVEFIERDILSVSSNKP